MQKIKFIKFLLPILRIKFSKFPQLWKLWSQYTKLQVGWVLSTSTLLYKSSATIKSNDLSHLNDLHVEIGSLNESKLIKKCQD